MTLRPADEPRPARCEREPELPRLLRRWVADGRRLPRPRQHRADDRVEHPLRPGGREDRVRGRGVAGPATDRPRPRRHREGEDPARPHRRARPTGRQHAGRLDRAGARRGPDARDAVRGQQPDRPASSRMRSATTWSSTPATTASTARSSTTRWPRPPPSTRAWSGRRRSPSTSSSDGTLTAGETVTDWRRVWGRPPNVDVAVEADAEEFLRRFVERVGGLASRLATAQT